MLQLLPQPLINKPKRKTTTSITLISDRVIILVTAPPVLPSKRPTIFHHHRTMMNRCKLPPIIIPNTRTRQEIEVSAVGEDPRTNWSCKLHLRDDRITHDGCFIARNWVEGFKRMGVSDCLNDFFYEQDWVREVK
jgi:hypothetical protein